MIQLTAQMRVLVGVEPADFRAGIDGLAERCRTVLETDPFSGTVFVFRNRRRTAISIEQQTIEARQRPGDRRHVLLAAPRGAVRRPAPPAAPRRWWGLVCLRSRSRAVRLFAQMPT